MNDNVNHNEELRRKQIKSHRNTNNVARGLKAIRVACGKAEQRVNVMTRQYDAALMGKLLPQDAEAVELINRGFTNRECSEILGITYDAFRVRVKRINETEKGVKEQCDQ